MANVYERLAALRPANTNEAELYAAAASIIVTLFICNQDSVARSYSVALTATSGAAGGEEWLSYEIELPANLTHRMIIPAGSGSTIRVKASIADKISFVLTGLRIT